MSKAFYFGVIDGIGHDMWASETTIVLPSGNEVKRTFQFHGYAWKYRRRCIVLPWTSVDCVLCPGERVRRALDDLGDVQPDDQVEGSYALHYRFGWTAMAWWDRSGRDGLWSNSVLFVQGTHTANEMLAIGRAQYPSVFARIDYEFVRGEFSRDHKRIDKKETDVTDTYRRNKKPRRRRQVMAMESSVHCNTTY